jgi:CBS domain-containing protein
VTFIVIAPGVRDILASSEVFAHRPVDETQQTARTRRAPEPESEHPPTEQQMINLGPHAGHARQSYEETAELPHERAPALLAEQIMTTPVITLGPDAPLPDAWALFREHRFRHIPIVSPERRIVGMLAEWDLMRDAAGMGAAARVHHATIRPLVTARVISATPNTEIREIAQLLYDRRIGAVPVLNATDYPIGIVTRSDILRALVTRAPLQLWV